VLTFINTTSPHDVICVHMFQEWNSPDELILRVKGVGLQINFACSMLMGLDFACERYFTSVPDCHINLKPYSMK
jgi:hypothetical protein